MSSNSISSAGSTLQNLLMQVRQDYQTLGSDLKSGDVDAAQKDFATLQQDALTLSQNLSANLTQNQNTQAHHHHHHHHHHHSSQSQSSNSGSNGQSESTDPNDNGINGAMLATLLNTYQSMSVPDTATSTNSFAVSA